MQSDRQAILEDEKRPDVEDVDGAGQGPGPLQEDVLPPSVNGDVDVRSALGVGALDLLRRRRLLLKLLPAERLQTHVLSGAINLKSPVGIINAKASTT